MLIVFYVFHDVVPIRAEKRAFGRKYCVLTTGTLVTIVNK
jgi:hypothetical protein